MLNKQINYKRVATQIAPYIVHDEERFIGAFIVEVRNDDKIEFESLVDAGVKFPTGLGKAMNPFGVLHCRAQKSWFLLMANTGSQRWISQFLRKMKKRGYQGS